MDRIYRIDHRERRATRSTATAGLCLIDGDVFGEYRLGDPIAEGYFPRDLPEGARLLAPVAAVEDRGRRPQLPRPRRRAEQAGADRAGHLHQAVDRGHRPGRRDPPPAGVGRIDYETEVGVVIGKAGDARGARAGARLRPRLHVRERRDRSRPAAARVPVLALQGVRHLRTGRPVHRDGLDPALIDDRGLLNGRAAPGVHDRAADLPRRGADRLHHEHHDPRAGRHHLDRHALGHRRPVAGRHLHGAGRGRRRPHPTRSRRGPEGASAGVPSGLGSSSGNLAPRSNPTARQTLALRESPAAAPSLRGSAACSPSQGRTHVSAVERGGPGKSAINARMCEDYPVDPIDRSVPAPR